MEANPLPDERTLDRKRLAAFNVLKRKRDEGTLKPIGGFLERLRHIKVLDPACGSGNFLYVAFQQLKELERDVLTFAGSIGLPLAPFVSPRQFYGLEVNVFAHELASIVVWIGYLQWNYLNHLSDTQRPILERLDNIKLQDALLDGDTETVWPEADFIIGNPPFLGDKKMRRELGNDYVTKLRSLYKDRISGQSNFVCYWFEKAGAQIEANKAKRVGLMATSTIKQKFNRLVLERIKRSGDIFVAWSNQPWVVEGDPTAVRVSLVGFDDGSQAQKLLDGMPVAQINADLSGHADVTKALRLPEHKGLSFVGVQKGGAFDIPGDVARSWLALPNPNGVPNSDVLKPFLGSEDVTDVNRDVWIIDFNQKASTQAESYVVPFDFVETNIKQERLGNSDSFSKTYWWLHQRTRPKMRRAVEALSRYIATPMVSKHRVFVWLNNSVLPSNKLVVITREDDFFFGVLSTSIHALWSKKQGGAHGKGDDLVYQNESSFETFFFPRPSETQHAEVEKWAKYLDTMRAGLLRADPSRTMTKLYNDLTVLRVSRNSAHPVYPLLIAHDKLDAAVAAAYGWEWPLSDEVILERLLALNLERAAQQGASATLAQAVAETLPG